MGEPGAKRLKLSHPPTTSGKTLGINTERGDSEQVQDTIENQNASLSAASTDGLAKVAATNAAYQRVFGLSDLNEILANILVHLPPQTIFGVQRVSKSFINATKMSPDIQEKLFLRQRVRSQWPKRPNIEDSVSPAGVVSPFLVGAGGRIWHLRTVVGTSQMDMTRSMQSSILDTFVVDLPRGMSTWQVTRRYGTKGRYDIQYLQVHGSETIRTLLRRAIQYRSGAKMRDLGIDFIEVTVQMISAIGKSRFQRADGRELDSDTWLKLEVVLWPRDKH